jgi:REP element-mobilizing transposase RayT
MPRKGRKDAPGAVHHIIVRGIERGILFRDDADRNDFLTRLGKILIETKTRCFAWALIPNHFHLLLKTGSFPVATVMGRLLTGYATSFNRRYHRSGHLFQNRYKSILCQEDVYLKELVRYIHLNPLRATIVPDVSELDRYPFSGHSYLMGKRSNDWQAMDEVLALFGEEKSVARRRYRAFLMKGIALGTQPDLVGGGLIRSAGGWSAVRLMRKAGLFQKSDERMLGDGEFVERVLSDARESMKTRYSLSIQGISIADIIPAVCNIFSIEPHRIIGPSKERTIVKARALVCYWAVRELGMTMTEVARHLKIALSTASSVVNKGEKIARDKCLSIKDILIANK